MPLLTLTTDFGAGHYVGQVKGVILSLVPGAVIVDVSHEIGRGNVLEAAYVLETVVPAFPEESVHVVVVDPGVGTDRKAIVVRYARRTLVAPDNGVLTAFLSHSDDVWEITNPAFFLPEVSATFHGRDIFAPVAAHLALGADPSEVGPRLESSPVTLSDLSAQGDTGTVLFVDRFGDVVTSFAADVLKTRPGVGLRAGDRVVVNRARTFGEAPGGEPFLYAGSSGRLEIAVAGDSAARLLGLRSGDAVALSEDRG